MRPAWQTMKLFLKREDGPTSVEYGIMLALIFAVVYGSIVGLGTSTNNSLTRSGNLTRTSGS
jgi:pilus assembly protein Flp/PilA